MVKRAMRTKSRAGAGADPAAQPKAAAEGSASVSAGPAAATAAGKDAGGSPATSADAPASSPGASAQASSAHTLEEAAGNGDGTYDGAKALAWLSQVLAGDRGLTEAEIREAFDVARERARKPTLAEIIEQGDAVVRASLGDWTLDAPIVRIVSQREGFRRAGLAHPKAPTDHPGERFSKADLVAIVGDPLLSASLVMPSGEVVPLALEGGALKLKPPAEAKE